MLDDLRRAGAIGGAEVAARFLPSQATQQARRAALPQPDVLAKRVAEALKACRSARRIPAVYR